MPKFIRNGLIAFLLLLVLISLPFWLQINPNIGDNFAEKQNTAVGGIPTQELSSASAQSNPPSAALASSKLILVDAGWFNGSDSTQEILHPPAIFRWDPTRNSADWRFETDSIGGVFVDDEDRIYFLEQQSLIILDGYTGEVLSRLEAKNMAKLGLIASQSFPITRQGNRLYFRNYNTQDNLFYYDLRTGLFNEERWTLCEGGYPFDSVYLAQNNSFVTFCYDFASGTQGLLTQLSIDDGTTTSVEIPILGAEEYMVGNGFAIGSDNKAYVVDSDAGALVEIDLSSMQILRQAKYRQAAPEKSWLSSSIAWLSDLAAKTARAKRWISRPVVSPDGNYLVVDGGFGIGGGVTTSAWLIALENLRPVKEIELLRSPEAFYFTGNSLLYILLVTDVPGNSKVMVFNLDSQNSQIYDVPSPGRVLKILH
jgi:hypothetical protein